MRNTLLTYNLLLSALILPGLCSCTAPSANPVVKLTTDWRNRTQGVDIPTHYTIKTRDLHLDSISEQSFLIPYSFQSGHHSIYVYNPAKNISIDGTTASVEVENEYIKAQPGWFFTSVHHVIMEENKNYDISAVMQQQTRELMFVLVTPKDFAEEIDHISASLNGVASQLDIPSGDVTGWPMSIKLDFTMNTDTTFVSTTRILGLIDETQILTCSITFNKDHLPIIHKVFELQTLLEDFNADKITPMNLSITIIPDSSSKSKKPETIR